MKRILYSLFAAALLLQACHSNSVLISSWKETDETKLSYQKIGVAALFPNSGNQYIIETDLAAELVKHKVNAMATNSIFPLSGKVANPFQMMHENPEIEAGVREKIKENGIDAVMLVSVKDQATELHEVKKRELSAGGNELFGTPYSEGASSYYAFSMATVNNADYYREDRVYFIECSLYDVASNKLIWRAETRIIDWKSIQEESKNYAEALVKQLMKDDILQ